MGLRIVELRRFATIAGASFVSSLASSPTLAQAQSRSLRWDPALDVTVTAGGAAIWMTSELLKPELAPARCRWCSVDRFDANAREVLLWRDTSAADTMSNVAGFAVVPLAAFGLNALAAAHDGGLGQVGEDSVLIAEAWVASACVTQLTKMLVGRERPFVHALPADEKALTAQPSDNNLSFFSGHSSEAFALAAAAGTIGTMRGYRWAPLVWTVGGLGAATTGYLRVAADKHWLTDVLAGAVVGGAIGFAVPFFFHPIEDRARPPVSDALFATRLPVLTFEW
jgi:membrane-associated phospholipid phosphatase